MDVIEYKEEYRNELEQMLADIQNYERRLNPEREDGNKVAKLWVDNYEPEEGIEKIFLGKFKGEIIGFIWIYFSKDIANKQEYEYLTISDLLIKERYRGKGFGKELIAFCEKLGKQRKVRGSFLTVLDKNMIARELYKNIGYQDLEVKMYKKL